nr:hypothetical protein [Enterovibrio nigricans]
MAHWINTETNAMFHNTLVDARPRYAQFSLMANSFGSAQKSEAPCL